MDTTLSRRLDDVDRQLALLRLEVASIREAADGDHHEPQPEPGARARVRLALSGADIPQPGPFDGLYRKLENADLADLLGARARAVAGGVVTLLGIVFFFVLAVDRGWIGPDARVLFGALASALLFGAGLWVQRRDGETYAALAAVGAGIAGGYATLLAAASLYHLLPAPAALVAATAIAGAGVATALVWDSQIVAGIGLVGALLVPAAVVVPGHGIDGGREPASSRSCPRPPRPWPSGAGGAVWSTSRACSRCLRSARWC